jgi:hypothetical protein
LPDCTASRAGSTFWNQISTGVAAVLPSKAAFSSAQKFF